MTMGFWFVHASLDGEAVNLAVAAYTQRSARVQARKRLGRYATIDDVSPVAYAHAWVINVNWEGQG